MDSLLWHAVLGTVVLWSVSATLTVVLGLVLTGGSLSSNRLIHYSSRATVNLSRGVPTGLIVVLAGIGTFHLHFHVPVPRVFPATPPSFQLVAWTVAIALAFGSAGHVAEIFRSARAALGLARSDQARVLGLSRGRRTVLLARESAPIALIPTSSRLVHHLHNTAFAALFPVTELFGAVQAHANQTFRVRDYALLGCLIYACLSAVVWVAFRAAEAGLVRARPARQPVTRPRRLPRATAEVLLVTEGVAS